MSGEAKEIPDWQIERFRLGELPAIEMETVRKALECNDTVRARLVEFEASDREILGAHPPAIVAVTVRARAEQATVHRPRPAVRLTPVAVVAAVAVLWGLSALLPTTRPARSPRDLGSSTRVKGRGPRLAIYRQGAAGPEYLSDGALVRSRDVVQVLYVAAGGRYGAVVSVDGRGTVTTHLPLRGLRAEELVTDRPTPLASAYALDDAPAFERFYFVTADTPFDVAIVTEAAGRLTPRGLELSDPEPRLDLPSTFGQTTILLRKEGLR